MEKMDNTTSQYQSIEVSRRILCLTYLATSPDLNLPLPMETMSQFTEPVIPDERRFAGRDPESSESDQL